MAISCVLANQASYDVARLARLTAVIFDNGATAAYDQVIPSQRAALSAPAGVGAKPIEMNLKALERAQCFVKVACGLSPASFQSALLQGALGLLQGSSEAHLAWPLSTPAQLGATGKLRPSAMASLLSAALPFGKRQ